MEVVRETVVKHRGHERQPRGTEWADLLERLARQLDDGRLYDRDLEGIRAALRLAAEPVADLGYVVDVCDGCREQVDALVETAAGDVHGLVHPGVKGGRGGHPLKDALLFPADPDHD